MKCPNCGVECNPKSLYCLSCFAVFEPDRRLYDDSEKGQAEYEAEIEQRKYYAGRARESHEKVKELTQQGKTTKTVLIISIAVIAIIFLVGIGITMSGNKTTYSSYSSSGSSYSSSSYISEDIKGSLWALAQQAVKNELKAPSTAKFPASYGSDGVSFGKSGDLYYVSAWVDAENGFGATLRTNFTVYASLTGTKLTLDHVDFAE